MSFVVLTFRFEQEEDGWFGKCVELGTATWAESLAQLEEELRDLVGLHLVTLEETGRLGEVFDEWKVKLHADMPAETSKSLPVSPWNNGRELRLFQPQMFLLPGVSGTTPVVASLHGRSPRTVIERTDESSEIRWMGGGTKYKARNCLQEAGGRGDKVNHNTLQSQVSW